MVVAQARGGQLTSQLGLEPFPSVTVLGCRVHNLGLHDGAEFLLQRCQDQRRLRVVTADSFGLLLASRDELFREVINTADLVTPDSAGVVWASRALGKPLAGRVPGIDLVGQVMKRGAASGLRVYLLGSAPGVAEQSGAAVSEMYPGLRVVGSHHGYFSEEDETRLIARINECQPQLLLCAMGIPKQDLWLQRNGDALGASVLIGVGGTLDVLSGRIRRAPAWMQRRGLEWLHRLLVNPRKISKCAALPRFVLAVLRERKRLRRSGISS